MILSLLLFSSFAFAADPPSVDPRFGKIVGKCKIDKTLSSKHPHVWIIKQWHLASSVNTKNQNEKKTFPQAENQLSIYRQLDTWIGKKEIEAIVAEGCSGELTQETKLVFNGWSATDLKNALKDATYDSILSSIPLKLEVKYGNDLKTFCGDDEKLVRENLLAFSDARGIVGFLTRLTEHKDKPDRAKIYLDGVIEMYKMNKATTIQQAISRLTKELRASVVRIKASIEKRNMNATDAIKTIKAIPGSNIAIVFGGIHAAGLVAQLEQSGFGCSVVEPVGYADDENQMMKKLDELLAL